MDGLKSIGKKPYKVRVILTLRKKYPIFGKENNIPVCMLFSGGYTPQSSKFIADSVTNIIKTYSKEKLTAAQN